MRTLRYLHHKSGLLKGMKTFWLGKWKHNLERYCEIVIEDSIFDYTPLEYIREIKPKIRVAFCFRNRVKAQIGHFMHPEELRKQFGCELWTYSQEDSTKYNMIKYNQFYLISKDILIKKPPIIYDLYFIGKDKHRMKKLIELKRKLDRFDLISKIEIVASSGIKYSGDEKLMLVPSIPYNEVLNNVLQSRCVIDIVEDSNYGMTFRCLEAMVLKKKLLTNYVDIKDVDFYCKNNIFILGVDDESQLKEFIFSPFDDSIRNKLKTYSYQYFCKQIFLQLT